MHERVFLRCRRQSHLLTQEELCSSTAATLTQGGKQEHRITYSAIAWPAGASCRYCRSPSSLADSNPSIDKLNLVLSKVISPIFYTIWGPLALACLAARLRYTHPGGNGLLRYTPSDIRPTACIPSSGEKSIHSPGSTAILNLVQKLNLVHRDDN